MNERIKEQLNSHIEDLRRFDEEKKGVETEFAEQANLESEATESVGEKIEDIREKLADIQSVELGDNNVSIAEKIKSYQDRYLPPYLKSKRGAVSQTLIDFWTAGTKFEIVGQENIPDTGPFLIVCNHFGDNDVQALLKTFKNQNLHLVVAKSIWWNGSAPAKWFMKQLKAIPVQESLANLSEPEKEEALKRQGGAGRKVFRKIIEQEKEGGLVADTEFVRQTVAVLSQGDAACIFPEGLWLDPQSMSQEKAEMKQGYRGLELVASQFKKLTGNEIPILPTAYDADRKTKKKKMIIDKLISLADNQSDLNGTDWCLKKVAEMLPEEKRGYYGGSEKHS